MKTQARRCWWCTISIPRKKRLTPDRRARCRRRSTNSTSFSSAWDQAQRQNDADSASTHWADWRSAVESHAHALHEPNTGRKSTLSAPHRPIFRLTLDGSLDAGTTKAPEGAQVVIAAVALRPTHPRVLL